MHLPDVATPLAGPPFQVAARADGSTESCPCRPTLDRLGDRWSSELIGVLEAGPLCAGQLRRRLGGISRKVLTSTLRGMERDGLVSREVLPDKVIRVRYRLTALGLALAEPLAVIRDWSQRHLPEVAEAQRAYDRRESPPSVTAIREAAAGRAASGTTFPRPPWDM